MEAILKLLRFLSAPHENGEWRQKASPSDNRPISLLTDLIKKCEENQNFGKIFDSLKGNCGPLTYTWKFTITLLDLLLQLKGYIEEAERNQTEEEKGIEVLSVQAQLDVQKCVEIVFGFGLLPYLLKDVGVPEKVRKKNPAATKLFLAEDHLLSPLIKFHRLAQVSDILLELCKNPSLSALIIPKHAADILAALLQICKSPISKPSSVNPKLGALSPVQYEHVMALRKNAQGYLDNFLATVPKGLVINSLFLIGEKPKFMRESCNLIMQDTLLSPNGLILISSTLLGESSASNVWGLTRVVANLMRNSLLRLANEDDYPRTFKRICCQCLQMISQTRKYYDETNNGETGAEIELNENANDYSSPTAATSSASSAPPSSLFGMSKEMRRIGLFCSIVLMDINCQGAKSFVWDHLFKPVLDLELGQRQDQCEMKSINRNVPPHVQQLTRVNEDIITFVDIERVIGVSEVAEGLLSLVIPTGISVPVHAFQPLWSLLFQIHVACRKYTLRKVQEPEVSQLAQVLGNKLESVFLLMLEVVSSGAGDKLCINIGTSDGGGKTCPRAPKNDTQVNNSVNTNISDERARTVCDFCIQLLLNEGTNCTGEKKSGVNSFELISLDENEKTTVKIARIARNRGNSLKDESGKENEQTSHDGCQSSSASDEYNNGDENTPFEVLADECVILSSILKHKRVAHITSQLFRQLLDYEHGDIEKENGNGPRKEGQKVLSKLQSQGPNSAGSSHNESTSKRTINSNLLTQLELELGGTALNSSSLRKFVVLKLLEELGGDETIENCVKTDDYKETLLIVEMVMKKLATELKESSSMSESFVFSQTIVFALGFLGTIVETACNSCPDLSKRPPTPSSSSTKKTKSKQSCQPGEVEDDGLWNELQRFAPHLKIIAASDNVGLVNSGIPAMAENILISITSKGKDGTLGKDKVYVITSKFEKSLEDVANPMLPIKGHGLLQLKRLIETKDPETLKNDKKLLQIFQTELTNEDSYVYLMAIQGLAALGLKFHNVVIPILIQEYDFINPGKSEASQERSKLYKSMTHCEQIACRMKIGEVLVKVIQQLGDMAPSYRVSLTNLFFRIVRDDEPMIRASALSNLGELCQILKFSLGTVLTEVWFNVEAILSCEKDVFVRRAGLHLLVLLLKGVEKEFTSNQLLTNVQLGGYLRDARRLLTITERREKDSIAKTHAQLALHEMQLIVKKLLVPKTEIDIKIRVLEA